MSENLITIGITCFNAADTIGRALDSALSQSWPHLEIIVTDDQSTDGSLKILKGYASRYAHVRIIENSVNRGVSYNRQKLLEEAQGQYIAYFDDDDYSFPERVELQFALLKDTARSFGHEKVICYGDRIMIKPGQSETVLNGIGHGDKIPHGVMVADMILGDIKEEGYTWGLMGSGTMLAKTSYLKSLGGFDSRFRRAAEVELAIRAAEDGAVFVSVPKPVIKQYYLATPDKSLWKMGKYHLLMIQKHWRIVLNRGLLFHSFYPFTRYIKKKLAGKS
jgi:glycosyltransferase involved in cell wall biosynthesis